MNSALLASAQHLAQQATGQLCEEQGLLKLRQDMSDQLPLWLIRLLADFPLAGLELGYQAHTPTDDTDGVAWMEVCDTALLRELALNSYPGMLIYDRGYVPFAYGTLDAGNIFVLDMNEGDDPPLVEVWHDISQDRSALLDVVRSRGNGTTAVSATLSGFLMSALVVAHAQ